VPVVVGVGVSVAVEVGVPVCVSVVVGEGVSVCVWVTVGVRVMAWGWKTCPALWLVVRSSGRISSGGIATIGTVAVGKAVADGAGK